MLDIGNVNNICWLEKTEKPHLAFRAFRIWYTSLRNGLLSRRLLQRWQQKQTQDEIDENADGNGEKENDKNEKK